MKISQAEINAVLVLRKRLVRRSEEFNRTLTEHSQAVERLAALLHDGAIVEPGAHSAKLDKQNTLILS